MPVRKTESRIPQGLQASDLGQAAVAPDGRAALVAFAPSPVARGRENTFVALVTDAAAGAAATVFNWIFEVNGAARPAVQTTVGEIRFAPEAVGTLRIRCQIGGANVDLSLDQQIVEPNAELEALIAEDRAEPIAGDPEVSRELVNERVFYYQDLATSPPETDPVPFRRFVFGLLHSGASGQRPAARRENLAALARSINAPTAGEFGRLALLDGYGAGRLRPVLLAMIWPTAGPKLAWAELPEDQNRRLAAAPALRAALEGLAEADKIDLFNLLRFPKTNIEWTARAAQTLRDRYFAGTDFGAVRTGFEGTRSARIVAHFREGPLARD